jgi:hypothetical protein
VSNKYTDVKARKALQIGDLLVNWDAHPGADAVLIIDTVCDDDYQPVYKFYRFSDGMCREYSQEGMRDWIKRTPAGKKRLTINGKPLRDRQKDKG